MGTLRASLIARLRAVGLFERVHPSETNFVFVTCASPAEAASIRETLAARWQVIVASTARLGAPAGLRIGVSLREHADRLIEGLTVIEGLREAGSYHEEEPNPSKEELPA